MATYTITANIELSIEVECPDRALKGLLTENELLDHLSIKCHHPNTKVSTEIDFSIDDIEVHYIYKSNDVEYDWDGENLTKVD
jgi:SAM-dependent MidA family methyltransferase